MDRTHADTPPGHLRHHTFTVTVLACIGMLRLKDESRIVDDLPKDNPVLTDLRFFESNFHGVMPLEIVVTPKKGGALKDATLKRIVKLRTPWPPTPSSAGHSASPMP
jgi:predicted RND superfamily exporter protein